MVDLQAEESDMSSMQIASEQTLQAGRKIIEQYGSWSAAIAKGDRRADGVVVLPPPSPAPTPDPVKMEIKTSADA